jgi:hypothetical protein
LLLESLLTLQFAGPLKVSGEHLSFVNPISHCERLGFAVGNDVSQMDSFTDKYLKRRNASQFLRLNSSQGLGNCLGGFKIGQSYLNAYIPNLLSFLTAPLQNIVQEHTKAADNSSRNASNNGGEESDVIRISRHDFLKITAGYVGGSIVGFLLVAAIAIMIEKRRHY